MGSHRGKCVSHRIIGTGTLKQIGARDRQNADFVYELYGLTEEEIKIVES